MPGVVQSPFISFLNILLVIFFFLVVALIVVLAMGSSQSLSNLLKRLFPAAKRQPSGEKKPAAPFAERATATAKLTVSCPGATPPRVRLTPGELPAEGYILGCTSPHMAIPDTRENQRISGKHLAVYADSQGFYLVDTSTNGICDASGQELSHGGQAIIRLREGKQSFRLAGELPVDFIVSSGQGKGC